MCRRQQVGSRVQGDGAESVGSALTLLCMDV